MTNICIYDWEFGMQDYIGNMINVPYVTGTWQKGGPVVDFNIIILSKPFDCMARKRKSIDKDSWRRRRYRYYSTWLRMNGDPKLYTEINNYMDKMSNKFIIHPRNLLYDYNVILPKLQTWLNLPNGTIQFNPDEYWKWYQKNVNIG
mgnify:CR=1 FL=1|tara:strand:+ start:1645 stop:2082 length:438 start_codon:yes stop_codon:yes gene_type:complete